MGVSRRTGVAAAVAAVALAGGAAWWLGSGAGPASPSAGVVTITTPPPPAPAGPAAPVVAATVPVPPDAFEGTWAAHDGARLEISRTAADRYRVRFREREADETYDGIFEDGRLQIPRGIDGEWLQAQAGGPPSCLILKAERTFCRSAG